MNMADTVDAIVKEIVINAPAERVFTALTDPAQRVKRWGAPGQFQTTHMESDLRAGGTWVMRGTGPGGTAASTGRSIRRTSLNSLAGRRAARNPGDAGPVRLGRERWGDIPPADPFRFREPGRSRTLRGLAMAPGNPAGLRREGRVAMSGKTIAS
jgi:hypothetical protein